MLRSLILCCVMQLRDVLLCCVIVFRAAGFHRRWHVQYRHLPVASLLTEEDTRGPAGASEMHPFLSNFRGPKEPQKGTLFYLISGVQKWIYFCSFFHSRRAAFFAGVVQLLIPCFEVFFWLKAGPQNGLK